MISRFRTSKFGDRDLDIELHRVLYSIVSLILNVNPVLSIRLEVILSDVLTTAAAAADFAFRLDQGIMETLASPSVLSVCAPLLKHSSVLAL